MQNNLRGALVDVTATAAACAGSDYKRVVAGDPMASLLYTKLMAKSEGVEAPCGDAMPQGEERPPLRDDELDRIRDWIVAGAPDD